MDSDLEHLAGIRASLLRREVACRDLARAQRASPVDHARLTGKAEAYRHAAELVGERLRGVQLRPLA